MDRDSLCESLILWVETFNLSVPHRTAEELSDGIAMAQVLHQIAPDYFNESWMSKIKSEDVTNWRLKVSNLKKILKGILEYNLEILGIQIHDFQMPDVNAIGENSNRGELGRLLQLILGCAVNCNEKQEYIQRIMSMEESVQHVVMTAIQELMTKEMATDGDSEVGEQLKRTSEELNSAIEAKEELMQRCHELDLQVTGLLEEKQSLVLENERLAERLNQAENLDDPTTPAGKRFQQIQHQLEQCQEENYKLETQKDDFRIKVDVLQKEVNEAKEKNAELVSLAEESRGLKDELDVLRHTAEQVVKYEAQIESYKKKMDELSDLRGQVKLLEDKNTKYMQENLEIQEEVRKAGAVKQQLDVYKRQVLEVQNKLTEETKRADKFEFESKRSTDKIAALQREKERIITERDSLKEVNEELKCTQLQTAEVQQNSEDISTSPGLEMLSMPPAIKEKMLRLEHENKMLQLQSSGESSEQSEMLQTMLDDANARKNELETDLRLANQKIMELGAQIEDLQELQKTTVSGDEMVEIRKKLNEQVQMTQQKDTVIQKERDAVLELQNQLTAHSTKIEQLQEEIIKKDEEKRAMEDKYKTYLEKAKAVIKSLDARNQSTGSANDVQALKNKLAEKQKYIEHLEKEQENVKSIRDEEEKLMVNAWYNLGMRLNRQAAEDRLNNSTSGQAFLNRQRQAHLRGRPNIPNSHPNPSSEHEDVPVELPPSSTDIDKSSGDGCFLTLLDWLSRVRGEQKRTNKGLNQSRGDNLLNPDTLNQTEFLAELLYDELYEDDCSNTGDGDNEIISTRIETNGGGDNLNLHDGAQKAMEIKTKFQTRGDGVFLSVHNSEQTTGEGQEHGDGLRSESNSDKAVDFGSEISVINVDSYNISVDQTIDNDVDFILGESDKSRTPLSILKAEVLDFGNEVKKNTPKTECKKGQSQKLVVPETPIFDQISVDSLNTSRTPLLDGSVSTGGTDNEIDRLAGKDEVVRLDFSNIDDLGDDINATGPNHSKQVCVVDDSAVKKLSNKDKVRSDNLSPKACLDSSSVIMVEENIVNIEPESQKTPLRSLENLPLHQTSPFVKKLATDKVTKRRSRRKRHIDSTGDHSDWSDMSDAKELCQGLSPGVSPGEQKMKNDDSDVEMDLLAVNHSENTPII